MKRDLKLENSGCIDKIATIFIVLVAAIILVSTVYNYMSAIL